MKYSIKFSLMRIVRNFKPIRIRITYDGKRLDKNIGYSVMESEWDPGKERVTFGNKYSTVINSLINDMRNEIDKLFVNTALVEKRYPTLKEIETTLLLTKGEEKCDNKTSDSTIFSAIDDFIHMESHAKNWTYSTIQKFRQMSLHIKIYKANCTFNDLNERGLLKFSESMLSKGLRNSTIQKNMKLLYWFLRWAETHDYDVNTEYKRKPIRMKGQTEAHKEIVYLEWEEVMKLYNHIYEYKYLENCRDIFLFCCFTGLRYSDLKSLKKDNVFNDYIDIVTQKTNDRIRIDLNKYSKEILDKYKNNTSDFALQVPTNQKYNEYLKTICREAGINSIYKDVYFIGNRRVERNVEKWEVITSHAARRTFVVIALKLGVPADVIMKWTGHSDYKAMQPYIAIVDDLKRKEMNKFNEL